jgi:hypothetical protein
MAKKQTFSDKLKKKSGGSDLEYVKVIESYKAENGAWKFRTRIVGLTEENRKSVMGS